MSLMSMRRKMAGKKSSAIIVWALIIVFTLGIVIMVLPNFSKDMNGSPLGDMPSSKYGKVVATVNGDDVTLEQMNWLFDKNINGINLDNAMSARQQVFEQLVTENVFRQVRKEQKIKVSAKDKTAVAKSMISSQLDEMYAYCEELAKTEAENAKKDEKAAAPRTAQAIYNEQIQAIVASYPDMSGVDTNNKEAFINAFTKVYIAEDKNPQTGANQLEQLTAVTKLGKKLGKDLAVSPFTAEFAERFNTKEVKASWIFIAAKENTESSLNEAKKKAEEIRAAAVKDPASFTKLAADNTDDFMTKFVKGEEGSLNWLNKSSTQSNSSPIAIYMAFAYKKGTITPTMLVANTGYFGNKVGYGFVYVQDERDSTVKPKDWANVAKTKTEETTNTFASIIGANYVQYKTNIANIKRESAELKYYEVAYTDSQKAAEILKVLAFDSSYSGVLSAAFKVVLLQSTENNAEKIILLNDIIANAGAEAPKFQIQLVRALIAEKRIDEAKDQLNFALMGISSNNDPDHKLHKDIQAIYKALGNKEKVAEIEKWMKENPVKKEGELPEGHFEGDGHVH